MPERLLLRIYGCPQTKERWWGQIDESPPKRTDGNAWLFLGIVREFPHA